LFTSVQIGAIKYHLKYKHSMMYDITIQRHLWYFCIFRWRYDKR